MTKRCSKCRTEKDSGEFWKTGSWCKPCSLLHNKLRRATDPKFRERAAAYSKNWLMRNPDKAKKYNKAVAPARRAWRSKHPYDMRAYGVNQRCRLAGAPGVITGRDVADLYDKQNGICATPQCGRGLAPKYHVDHIMPILLGGQNLPSNLQLLCPSCSAHKQAMHPAKWDAERSAAIRSREDIVHKACEFCGKDFQAIPRRKTHFCCSSCRQAKLQERTFVKNGAIASTSCP